MQMWKSKIQHLRIHGEPLLWSKFKAIQSSTSITRPLRTCRLNMAQLFRPPVLSKSEWAVLHSWKMKALSMVAIFISLILGVLYSFITLPSPSHLVLLCIWRMEIYSLRNRSSHSRTMPQLQEGSLRLIAWTALHSMCRELTSHSSMWIA